MKSMTPSSSAFAQNGSNLRSESSLALDAAADGGPAQPELSHGLIELIGGEIRVLQRQRRHSHETVWILRDRGSDLFILHGDSASRASARSAE